MEYNESINILIEDFSSSYEQMRYYDGQINELMKFSIGLYTTFIAGLIALLGVSSIDKAVLSGILTYSSLFITFFGLIILFSVLKNRVYFVQTARYVNEIRSIAIKSANFENNSKMYSSYKYPKYISFTSTQLVLAFLCSVFNTISSAYLFQQIIHFGLKVSIIVALLIEICQVVLMYMYLINHEKKS